MTETESNALIVRCWMIVATQPSTCSTPTCE